jgi:hypothetical protein
LIAELQPRDLAFFSEPIAVADGWGDAPCGYVRLSAAYDRPFAAARDRGWATRRFEAQHFHMLVAPEEIVSALSSLAAEMGV